MPPRTLYRVKCVLAVIIFGCQKKMAASTLRVKNSCAKPAQTSLGTEGIDQPEKAHRGDCTTRRHTRKSWVIVTR